MEKAEDRLKALGLVYHTRTAEEQAALPLPGLSLQRPRRPCRRNSLPSTVSTPTLPSLGTRRGAPTGSRSWSRAKASYHCHRDHGAGAEDDYHCHRDHQH